MALVKYACETCGRVWDTEAEANTCTETHQGVVLVTECRYRKKAEPEKYPNSILCTMADGESIVYYIGRAEKQPSTPVLYKSQVREQNVPSVRKGK